MRFDFVVQVLGHHLGLGSPGSLAWCPQDLVQTTEQMQTELGAEGQSSELPFLLPNTQPRAFSTMQSLAPSCALSF